MSRFKIMIHRRVYKYLKKLEDEKLKNRLKDVIFSLEKYPLILRRLDVEKLEGLR